MIDTILFDFDGTVMDTNKVIIESWQHTYRTLTGHDGNVDYILATFGEPLELSLENAFPDVPVDESVNVYRTWHRDNFMTMIELFPGIMDLLKAANDKVDAIDDGTPSHQAFAQILKILENVRALDTRIGDLGGHLRKVSDAANGNAGK